MNKTQWQLLLDYFSKFGGHSIVKLDSLQKAAAAAGLRCVATTDKQTKSVALYDENAKPLVSIGIQHCEDFVADLIAENRGGSVQRGDWYGFSMLQLVESLAISQLKYYSDKNGRGSRYYQIMEKLQEYVETMN